MISEPIKYAGFWLRFVANVVDTTLLTLITWAIGIVLFYFTDPRSLSAQLILFAVYSFISLIYFSYAHFRFCTTIGKKLLGAYVVSDFDQSPLNLRRSIIRALGYWVSWLPLGAGYFMAGINSKKVGLHDMMARSIVVRKI